MSKNAHLIKGVTAAFLAWSLAASPVCAGEAEAPLEGARKWDAWTELGGYAANRSDARRGELTLWAPFAQDASSLFFLDLRGKLFAEDQQEGNAALGYRFMTNSGWNPGVWVGFDRRNSGFGANFDQISFGLEALSPDWDLRLNGYAPLNDRELVARSSSSVTTTSGGGGPPTVEVIGNGIFMTTEGGSISTTTITTQGQRYELALWGVDAEVGYRIPLERFGHDPAWGLSLKDAAETSSARYSDLRIFAGGFYFDNADLGGEVAGPRARLEWRIENVLEEFPGSRLTFETAWQHDDVRGQQVEGGVRLRIPLGGERGIAGAQYALSAQERRMSEGLKRDTDIVTQSKTETRTQTVTAVTGSSEPTVEPVEDAQTGVDLDTVLMVANGDNLAFALITAGGNALVVADGGGTAFTPSAMQNNQTLLGGGGLLQVRGRSTGTLAVYTAPGSRPTIASASGLALQTALNSHVQSLDIDGQPSGTGISVTGAVLPTVIEDVVIDGGGTAMFGIRGAVVGSNTIVRDSLIINNDFGFASTVSGTVLSVLNSRISNFGSGIVAGNTMTLTLTDTTFDGTASSYLLEFLTAPTTATSGSIGNIDATTGSIGKCHVSPTGSLIGTITFADAVVTDASCL